MKTTDLTGNRQIEFLRDFSNNTYQLKRGGVNDIDLDESHFHPIFFAKDVEQLR